jgi:hypothetical protein
MTYRRETVTTEEVVEAPATEPAPPAPRPTSVNINVPQDTGTTVDESSGGVAGDDGPTVVNIG